jgi:hypothetical protein
MEEDCVEPEILGQSNRNECSKSFNGCITNLKKSVDRSMFLKLAGSPMASDLRKSLKDVAYMTPGKSNRSMINGNNPNSTQFIDSKLYRMIECCVKMECAGCRKLIPTHLFYDHL